MAALPGNQTWRARSKHGRNPIFADPDKLWDACCQYFDWIEEHPLMAAEVVKFQGEATLTQVPKMRAMTISGMCLYLDIAESSWASYRERDGFLGVTTRAEKIIYNQKFTGAAADLFNANIIARDLGLRDGVDNNHTGTVGLSDMSQEALDAKIKELEGKLKGKLKGE